MTKKEFSMALGGRTLSATFSDLADQANGSVLMRYGDTIVLVTAVMSRHDKLGDYFPLVVDYEEKFYAAGKIMGSRFIKRENRPSDEAILSGRVIDRTIRPLFDQDCRREVQVVATVLSVEATNDPDTLAIIGASLALGTSDIPWAGPVSAVRVGGTSENLIINPATSDPARVNLDLLICGKAGEINMIEAEGLEIPEPDVKQAMSLALAEIAKIEAWQDGIIKEMGKEKSVVATTPVTREQLALVRATVWNEMKTEVYNGTFKKPDTSAVHEKWQTLFKEKYPEATEELAYRIFDKALDQLVHEEAIVNNKRPDGRDFTTVRPLYTEAGGLSEIVHGVGIFYRGATHVLSVLTLGGPNDAQIIEGMEVSEKKRFMHHYNFPPFSSGEVGRMGGTNRRSVGHGALAEKALRATLPPQETFPYTIRLVSESTASNGSTSMASVCASTLALMDGGVPITRPTAGIAMGLMMDNAKGKTQNAKLGYKILTDIQGPEDHHGDMDLKVAGTDKGITAMQMDVKVGGIKLEILIGALGQAKEARLEILKAIKKAIPTPRADIKPSAPKILTMKVAEDQIGLVIGSGGKTINKIIEVSGADVNIEEDGTVFVTGRAGTAELALAMVKELVTPLTPGAKHEAEVIKLLDFGIVVKIGHFNEGLVHISEIAPFRIGILGDAIKLGDKVPVMVLPEDDRHPGKLRLSIKATDPKFAETKGLKPPAGGPTNPLPPRR